MKFETNLPLSRIRWRVETLAEAGDRIVAEETPVAMIHNGGTTAVMMATPNDLAEFALGFSLSERIIDQPSEILDVEIVSNELGIELRIWLANPASGRLAARRRHLAGPTGCGLCGIDSLTEAVRSNPVIEDRNFAVSPAQILSAMASLEEYQGLGKTTRAVHAAALWRDNRGLIVREDVGRHNALDKLVGAAVEEGMGAGAMLLLTSRVSVEMVQKAAVLGTPVLCAVSAPTALAIRVAEAAGITLIGVARRDGFEIFTHKYRITF